MSEDPGRVVVEAELDAPPETVWRALTEPDLIAAWLGEEASCVDEVEGAEPQSKITWNWRGPDDDRASVVSVELTPRQDGGTHFRLVHSVVAAPVILAFPRRLPVAAPASEMRLKWAA